MAVYESSSICDSDLFASKISSRFAEHSYENDNKWHINFDKIAKETVSTHITWHHNLVLDPTNGFWSHMGHARHPNSNKVGGRLGYGLFDVR